MSVHRHRPCWPKNLSRSPGWPAASVIVFGRSEAVPTILAASRKIAGSRPARPRAFKQTPSGAFSAWWSSRGQAAAVAALGALAEARPEFAPAAALDDVRFQLEQAFLQGAANERHISMGSWPSPALADLEQEAYQAGRRFAGLTPYAASAPIRHKAASAAEALSEFIAAVDAFLASDATDLSAIHAADAALARIPAGELSVEAQARLGVLQNTWSEVGRLATLRWGTPRTAEMQRGARQARAIAERLLGDMEHKARRPFASKDRVGRTFDTLAAAVDDALDLLGQLEADPNATSAQRALGVRLVSQLEALRTTLAAVMGAGWRSAGMRELGQLAPKLADIAGSA